MMTVLMTIFVAIMVLPALFPTIALPCSIVGWPIYFFLLDHGWIGQYQWVDTVPNESNPLTMLIYQIIAGVIFGSCSGRPVLGALAMIVFWQGMMVSHHYIPVVT